MPRLFDIDIAAIVGEATAGKLVPATLTKAAPTARTMGSLTAGTNPTFETASCEGILEDYRESQIDGTRVVRGDKKVLLIAASIAGGATPEAGDQVTIEGQTLSVVAVTRDPAEATHTCQVRGT